MGDHVTEAFNSWYASLDEGWFDDGADACSFESSLVEAFEAGYESCLADHP